MSEPTKAPARPTAGRAATKKELPEHFKAYKHVWVFVEQERGQVHPVSWELMGAGRKLADKLKAELAAVVLAPDGEVMRGIVAESFCYGADLAYVVADDILADYRNESYTKALTDLVNTYKPEILLLGATTLGRDLAGARGLSLLETARLAAMVNLVGADALGSALYAKYHYLFWRPVTAIDPSAVIADGFGPVPGYDDGNPATVVQTGWRPLLTTPNHPEYPAAHGVITSAMAEVFSTFLGTNQIDLDLHGFDPAGPAGNLNAVRHFDRPNALRHEIIDARLWAGLHYRFSGIAGVVLGRKVAKYDLRHAFRPVD